jgi:cell division protein FtsI/penicillin-binding protein 2
MAQRYRFPGVEIKARLFRNYPLGETGSHVLGYIGRINQAEKEAIEEWDEAQGNYKGTEYIGKLGVEQAYESVLHGTTGVEEVETAAGGRAVRRLKSTHPRRATSGRCSASTSSCRSWWRSCSASAAARWWPWTRARARCWPS